MAQEGNITVNGVSIPASSFQNGVNNNSNGASPSMLEQPIINDVSVTAPPAGVVSGGAGTVPAPVSGTLAQVKGAGVEGVLGTIFPLPTKVVGVNP